MTYSTKASYTFGVVFLAAGILGFIPNPIVSPDGIFAVNTMHNIVHILTAAAFFAGAGLGMPQRTIQVLGGAYVAVTIVGFLTSGNTLLGMVHINQADRWLHAGLAVLIVGTATWLSSTERHTA